MQAVNHIPAERLADNPSCDRRKEEIFCARPVELTEENFRRTIERWVNAQVAAPET